MRNDPFRQVRPPGKWGPRYSGLQVALAGAILGISLAACATLFPQSERDEFIKVSGIHFLHYGKPYYFGGANLWYGCYLGSPGPTGDRPRLLRELDSLKANGLTNLRVLAASEKSYIKHSVKPAIQRAPGVVDDSLLEGLDYLLAAMAERRISSVDKRSAPSQVRAIKHPMRGR